ncbi:MAG: hypothetical protein OSB21_09410, partial [Myxococcota bacterium]|nr:hypothetical protein [Myxococcota bacterium]
VTPAAKALAEVEMVSNWGTGQAGEAGPMKVVAEIQPDKNEAREACGGELPDEVARECPDGAISQNCYFDVNGSVSTSSLPGVTVSAGCTISAPPECLAALIEHCLFGDYSSPADGYSKSKEDFDITLVNSAGLSLSGGVSLLDNYSEEGGTIEITVSRLPMHAKTEMTTTAPADRCLLAQEVETVTGTDIFTFLNGTTTTAKASSKARVERHIHRVYIPGSNNNISATIIGPKIDSRENTEVTAVGQGVALTCGGGGAIGGGVGVERPDQTTPPVNTDQPICLKDNDCGTHGSICVCRDADGAVVNDAVSCSGCECEVGCRTEGDCELGERCMDGVCIVPECIEDAECGPGMRCDEEICVPDPCEDSSDCADGEYCHEGDCHPQLTNCSACDEAVVNQCGEVDDGGPQFCHLGRCRWLECDDQHPCCDGETCDGGDCVADPQPGCVENTDCPDGEICMAGACEPPECSDGNPCPEDQLCTDFRCVLGEAGECDVPGAPVCPNNGCCRTNICHDQGSPDCQNP